MSRSPQQNATDPMALTFTVSPATGGEATIHAWCFLPQHPSDLLPRLWLLGIPGGSYRGLAYFDRHVPGCAPEAFSMARHLASQGIGLLAIDVPGTGESLWTRSGDDLTPLVVAECYRLLTEQVRARLETDPLLGARPQDISPPVWLGGIGHSLGAMQQALVQATHACFDGVLLLGLTNSTLPSWMEERQDLPHPNPIETEDGYLMGIRTPALEHFFYTQTLQHEVPDLITADRADATRVPLGLLPILEPASLQSHAAQITVPVLHVLAEHDLSQAPHDEGRFFGACPCYTFYQQRGAAHCNFEQSRWSLWRFLAAWVRMSATTRSRQGADT